MLPKDERQSGIVNFPPGYFALVMATGIVSIAFHQLGVRVIAIPFLWLNVLFYIVLWAITLTRAHPEMDYFELLVKNQVRSVPLLGNTQRIYTVN